MNDTARPADRKISPAAVLFKKVLQAFGNGDLPYSDVQSDLQRLLAGGAAPDELREVMLRYESIEPLQPYAHVEILRVLNEASEQAAALKAESDAVQGSSQDASSAPASQIADLRPGERPPEPAAGAAEARTPRPVPVRTAARSEPAPSAENVSSIEDRIARQKADYRALNNAYERARDAGSAAAARTTALTAELAAARNALEAEQSKARALDKALAESRAASEAERGKARALDKALAESKAASEAEQAKARALDKALAESKAASEAEQAKALALDKALAESKAADEAVRARNADALAARSKLEANLQAESARAAALGAELAEARAALEAAKVRVRESDQALPKKPGSEKFVPGQAARVGTEQSSQEAGRYQAELQALRVSLAARDSDLAQARTSLAARDSDLAQARSSLAARDTDLAQARDSLGKRDAELAALQRERTQLTAALESRDPNRVQLEADLQASRARAVALTTDLASAHAALASEQNKVRETRKALAERTAADEAAQAQREELLRRSELSRAELSKLRDAHTTLQQEHTKIVAALESRAKALDLQLQAARARADERPAPEASAHEVTVALTSPRDRAVARESDWLRPAPQPESRPGFQFPQFPLFGSRGGGTRLAGFGAAMVVLAIAAWGLIHRTPVPESAPVKAAAAALPGTVIRDCPTCPALTVVPKGRFKQGSDRTAGATASFERPPHWVLIGRPFAIATNAVTVDEFRAFVTATARDMRGCDTYDDRWRVRPDASWENPGFVQTGSHPVTCVSWDDAKAYAAWLSKTTGHRYRLPSAAEWEYAARAGGEAVQPWGSDGSAACASANVADQRAAHRYPGWAVFGCDDGFVYTAPVGSFKANAFGLNDMLGNVFQWTDDCWHADYTGVPTDGSARTYGDCSERELRGGSWFTTPDFVRASYRNHFRSNYRASTVGIRLVRDIAL